MEDPSILCAVCLTEFDNLLHIPKFLVCHHSICIICINTMAIQGRLQYPLCRKTSASSKLQTNNDLLELTRRIKEEDLKADNLRIQELTYGEQLLDVQDKIKSKESEISKSEASLKAKVGGTSNQQVDDNLKCYINPDNTHKESHCDKKDSSCTTGAASTSHVVEFPKTFEVIIDQQQQAINARNLVISNLRRRLSTLTQELLAARQTILELESKFSSKK